MIDSPKLLTALMAGYSSAVSPDLARSVGMRRSGAAIDPLILPVTRTMVFSEQFNSSDMEWAPVIRHTFAVPEKVVADYPYTVGRLLGNYTFRLQFGARWMPPETDGWRHEPVAGKTAVQRVDKVSPDHYGPWASGDHSDIVEAGRYGDADPCTLVVLQQVYPQRSAHQTVKAAGNDANVDFPWLLHQMISSRHVTFTLSAGLKDDAIGARKWQWKQQKESSRHTTDYIVTHIINNMDAIERDAQLGRVEKALLESLTKRHQQQYSAVAPVIKPRIRLPGLPGLPRLLSPDNNTTTTTRSSSDDDGGDKNVDT